MSLLLSRAAENLYWSARYLERAENTAKVIVQHTNLIVDLPAGAGVRWDALLAVTGNVEAFEQAGREPDEHTIVSYLIDDDDNPSSIVLAVRAARDNLRGARELIPRPAWQAVNEMYHFVAARHEEGVSRAGRARFCDQLISDVQRVVGVLAGTMSRDVAYDMLRLGRHLERADMTTRVLDVAGGALMRDNDAVGQGAFDDVQWAAVLRSLSALQMYRRATRGPIDGPTVVRFCLTNPRFPRSVEFCLDSVDHCLAHLEGATPLIGVADAARAELGAAHLATLDGAALHELADRLQEHIAGIHSVIAATYFDRDRAMSHLAQRKRTDAPEAAPVGKAEGMLSSIASYHGLVGRFDEALDANGAVRTSWSQLAGVLDRMPTTDLATRARSADRLLLAAGATNSRQSGGTTEAWNLDPVPLVYAASEWATLAQGLEQRARLFEALLTDLYGDRRLVTNGLLPVELVHAARGFQPAAVGWRPTGRYLTVYAADVARDAEGRFVVLRDHTDAPRGAGRALLNRSVLARVLPDAFRRTRVTTIAPWYDELRTALGALVPPGTSNPRVVLLAPPLDDPNYAEQAHLATHLGYNLVGANDLTVRHGKVYLRSIGGLEAVDVILRTVGDAATDPLEATSVGAAGIAGLTVTARQGSIGLANGLGSSLAGALALAPYLPTLCAELLDESLLLMSLDTLWCGDHSNAERVISDLDGYILHDASPAGTEPSVFGWDLDGRGRDAWTQRLRTMPWRVVAEPKMAFATAPTVDNGSLIAGTAVLRSFVINHGDHASVMPGGLGRVVRTDAPVLTQQSTSCKDVWVLVEPNTPSATLRPSRSEPLAQIDLRQSLPSRAAEALFWIGRNAERAEVVARTALVSGSTLQQDPDLAEAAKGTWVAVAVDVLGAVSGRVDGVVPTGSRALHEAIAYALADRPGGLTDSLAQLQRSTSGVREFLSTATWRVLASLETSRAHLLEQAVTPDSPTLEATLDLVVTELAAFAGLAQESVVRGPSWRFLDLGRRVERAQVLVAALAAGINPTRRTDVDGAIGELLLASSESLVAYRRRYRSDVRTAALVDLLVADDTNPRSMAFQLDRISEDVSSLPERPGQSDCLALAHAAASRMLDLADVEREPRDFVAALADVRGLLVQLAEAVTRCWFVGLEPRGDAVSAGSLVSRRLGADR